MTKKKIKDTINVQELYTNWMSGKKPDIKSDAFYKGTTNLIKKYLMVSLIYKGYYKNGVKQNNFDLEDINDCFAYVYGKILDKYDSKKGTLATFIRTWIQGYGTIVTQKQKRKYRYLSTILPLDLNLQKSICDGYKDPFTFDDLGNIIDEDHFGTGYIFSFSIDEIIELRTLSEEMKLGKLAECNF